MKRYPKDPIAEALSEAREVLSTKIEVEDVDLVDLLDKSKEILRREVKNLMAKSVNGPLKSRESESLISYINLLNKMVKEEKDKLKGMSEEELNKLNETK